MRTINLKQLTDDAAVDAMATELKTRRPEGSVPGAKFDKVPGPDNGDTGASVLWRDRFAVDKAGAGSKRAL